MADIQKGYTFSNGEIITPAKLHALVDDATVADGSITTAKLANSLVTTAKIADANITTPKIADANITTPKIADANITTPKIADGAVTSAKLGNDIILVPAGAIMPFAMNSAPSGWLAANGSEYAKTGTYAALFSAIGTTYGETNGSGGAGNTHFRVPDLRGYFVRGSGTNSDGTASGTFAAKQTDAYKSHNHGGATGTGTTGNESNGHTHSGTTGTESQGHTHSGTTGNDNQNHSHFISGNTGTESNDHQHYSNGAAGLGQGASGPNTVQQSGGSQLTSGVTSNHYHAISFWSQGVSNLHNHHFTTGGVSANHTHSFTTGGISANHTHSVPSLSISADGGTETRPKNIALLYCIKF